MINDLAVRLKNAVPDQVAGGATVDYAVRALEGSIHVLKPRLAAFTKRIMVERQPMLLKQVQNGHAVLLEFRVRHSIGAGMWESDRSRGCSKLRMGWHHMVRISHRNNRPRKS